MKIAILGRWGHWSLIAEALAREPGEFAGCAFHAAPGDAREDMGPVVAALEAAAGGSPGMTVESHADWRALLDAVKPDVAMVNPRFDLIGPLTLECLRRGIHVLSEKPMAITWEDLRALRGLYGKGSEHGSAPGRPKLISTFSMRYAPEFLAGYRFVAGGGIGRPALLSAQKSYPLEGWDGLPRPDFYHRRATYGGTIPWVAMHAIDLIRWFAGAEFASVAAAHTTLGNQGHGELESAAVMRFRMAGGAVASAQVDFLRRRPGPSPDRSAADGAWGDDRLRVAGEGGVLEIREGRAWAVTADGRRHDLQPVPAPPLFADFCRWVRTGQAMPFTTEDCLAAAEATLRARDSADRDAQPAEGDAPAAPGETSDP